MIVLYATLDGSCGKCMLAHNRLKEKNVKFELISDEDAILEVAQKLNIHSKPFALIDKKVYCGTELMQYINKIK